MRCVVADLQGVGDMPFCFEDDRVTPVLLCGADLQGGGDMPFCFEDDRVTPALLCGDVPDVITSYRVHICNLLQVTSCFGLQTGLAVPDVMLHECEWWPDMAQVQLLDAECGASP